MRPTVLTANWMSQGLVTFVFMAKKRRKRGGRTTTPIALPGNPLMSGLVRQHQQSGALGVVGQMALMLGRSEWIDAEPSFIAKIMDSLDGRVGAMALATIGQMSPDADERSTALALVDTRRTQLSGVFRRLDQTIMGDCQILTDEYSDSELVLIEMQLGGNTAVTIVAQDDLLWSGWPLVAELFACSAQDALERLELDARPGKPRRVTRPLSQGDLCRRVWELRQRRRVEDSSVIGASMLAWAARLLEVDVAFPEIPFEKFQVVSDPDREEADLDEHDDLVFERFGESRFAGDWCRYPTAEIVDYLVGYAADRGRMGQLEWSPARVRHFFDRGTETDDIEPPLAAMFPALLRAWVRFAAEETGQRKPLLQCVLAEIDLQEPQYLASLARDLAA
jgi:hypothetical protein